jgi:hypothetical protein
MRSRRAAPNQDAAIAGSANRVAGNLQPARIDGENRRITAADAVGADFALDRLERNAVAPGIDDLAIRDTDRDARCSSDTFDRGIRRQLQRARTIETWRQPQDRARGSGLLDGALKDL